MPRRLLPVLLTLGFMPSAWSQTADPCEHLVAIGVGERAPYQWRMSADAQPRGASVVLLRQVAAELGVTLEILTAESLEQAEREVISGRADLLMDAEPRPELLAELDFLQPPLHQVPVVAWVAKGRTFAFQDWEDLRARRADDAAAGEAPLRLTAGSDFAKAVQGMLDGESDYVLFEQPAGHVEVLRQGWGERIEVLLPPVYSEPRYLALSHSSACNSAGLRGALEKALQGVASEAADGSVVREEIRQWVGQQNLN